MDAEIRKAIDAIRADLRGLEARLRSDLHAEAASLESKLRTEFRAVADGLALMESRMEELVVQTTDRD